MCKANLQAYITHFYEHEQNTGNDQLSREISSNDINRDYNDNNY